MCWQIPEWASGAANDRHHRAKQILASPIVTTYPQGSGCSVCVAQEKICTVSSDYVRCAYCTARGKRRALCQLPSTSAGAVGPMGEGNVSLGRWWVCAANAPKIYIWGPRNVLALLPPQPRWRGLVVLAWIKLPELQWLKATWNFFFWGNYHFLILPHAASRKNTES